MCYLHVFGRKCYILRDREHLKKFDARDDEGIFLGYSTNSHAFSFNKRTGVVMESFKVRVEDIEHCKTGSRNSTIKDEDNTPDMVTPQL